MRKFLTFSTALALVVSFLAVNASASIITSFTPTDIFSGQDHSLGYRFTVNSNTTVNALGFFDNNLDGLPNSPQVGLFDSVGTLLGSVTVPTGTGGTLIGDFRYQSLVSAINLAAGNDYYIAGTTLGSEWVFQAQNIVTDAAFTYVNSYFTSGTGGNIAFPDQIATDREYITVNATFVGGRVPEPGTILIWSVFAGTGLVINSRRRKVA